MFRDISDKHLLYTALNMDAVRLIMIINVLLCSKTGMQSYGYFNTKYHYLALGVKKQVEPLTFQSFLGRFNIQMFPLSLKDFELIN